MKKLLYALFVILVSQEMNAQTYEYQILTSVESIVPGGIGRSRLIANTAQRDFNDFTSKYLHRYPLIS